MLGTVKVCRDVRSTCVGLGPLPTPSGRVVGVEMPSEGDDASAALFVVLGRALVADARVTFLDEALEPPLPPGWEARAEDHVVELPLGGARVWTRRLSGLLGFPEMRGLVSTRRAKRAARLFDSAYFHGWAQAQVALLSRLEAAPPPIDAATLDALLSDAWIDAIRSLEPAGVVGGMRPGVDGDVAGLFFLEPARGDAFLEAFRREADGFVVEDAPSEAFP